MNILLSGGFFGSCKTTMISQLIQAVRERGKEHGEEFRGTICAIPKETVVYVDETGIDQYQEIHRQLRREGRGFSRPRKGDHEGGDCVCGGQAAVQL